MLTHTINYIEKNRGRTLQDTGSRGLFGFGFWLFGVGAIGLRATPHDVQDLISLRAPNAMPWIRHRLALHRTSTPALSYPLARESSSVTQCLAKYTNA